MYYGDLKTEIHLVEFSKQATKEATLEVDLAKVVATKLQVCRVLEGTLIGLLV